MKLVTLNHLLKKYLKICFCFLFFFLRNAIGVNAQQPYFVDGYHGGIYGHYPVEWKTQFIVDQLAAHPDWRICLDSVEKSWFCYCFSFGRNSDVAARYAAGREDRWGWSV